MEILNTASQYMTTIAAFVVALGILIFVHEFGHFIVARKLGVGVTKFSFGFGPKLFGIKRGETEYLVSAIPLGGYVKLIGESDVEPVPEELQGRSFSSKPIWVRMAVVAAGPVGNIVFAVLAYWIFFTGGVQALATKIDVAPDSPAARAGLKSGDSVLSVEGEPVSTWEEMDALIRRGGVGKPLSVTARRGSEEVRFTVTPETAETVNLFGEKEPGPGIGVAPAVSTKIGSVLPKSPAEKAGLRKDDVIVSVDGSPVTMWKELAGKIRDDVEGKPLVMTVRRGTGEFEATVTPELREAVNPAGEKVIEPRIGIGGGQETVFLKVGPLGAMVRAVETTAKSVQLTVTVVVKLITRVVPAKTLGGPILIAQLAGDQAREGFSQFAYFLGFLSVQLGILNLLPVPILDGGHLLFFSIEGLRRKPLSPGARALAQQVGLALILMLMALVFYNDFARLLAG